QDGIVTVDVFALRREKGGSGLQAPRSEQKPAARSPRQDQTPVAASLNAEEPEAGGPAASAAPAAEGELAAPLGRPGVAVRRGESVVMDVVVRTRKVGHAFPGGTFDAFDTWVELKGVDDHGKVIFWSGNLEWPDGPVERGAHFYQAFLLDAHGNRINKRNA